MTVERRQALLRIYTESPKNYVGKDVLPLKKRGPRRRAPIVSAPHVPTNTLATEFVCMWIARCSDTQQVLETTRRTAFASEMLESVLSFLKCYGGAVEAEQLALPWLYYCTKYFQQLSVHTARTLTLRSLFHRLLVVALVACKFWNDFEITNSDVANLFQIDLKSLARLERQVLAALDYNFYLSPASISSFGASLSTAYLASKTITHHNVVQRHPLARSCGPTVRRVGPSARRQTITPL
eukprot:CAMPEP_0201553034 /NCGR_PEP_ID=MMETSP0173_2-20130828/19402_1 /ASSEMBLY_ACC=CAM_ASM_000268 /TAXON_ID=218659 /ORGANISM="Vexillifera sp., Strain DIVA3 564/2" /LENGTH=238 /DNA_ID=CAMNT_0047963635 /DNA_START=305 /DNA_END=1021 /DNA_ORIENTATION=-